MIIRVVKDVEHIKIPGQLSKSSRYFWNSKRRYR